MVFKNTCWLGTEIGWITAVVTPDFGVEDPIVKETEVVFFWALKRKQQALYKIWNQNIFVYDQ